MPDLDPELEKLLSQLVGRLRGFSARAWAAGGRRDVVRRLAADLVELGEPGHVLPHVPDYAYADVVAVLAREAHRYQSAQQQGRRDEIATALRVAWDGTS